MTFTDFFKAPMKAYWWKEVPNFGDAIAPFLLEQFAGIKVEWGTISHSSIASIGSVLEHVPPLWDGYILGSGKLFENSRLHSFKKATILAVRGPLSARHVGRGDYALGDPGLLANELVGPQEKQWDLGIVPHWQDGDLVEKFQKLMPAKYSTKVIDPKGDPLEVIRQIGASRRIVTSSLHGMIVADAFSIARRVEICSKMKQEGGDFKFRDYSASIQTPFETGKMFAPRRGNVENAQHAIYDAYKELGAQLKK